MDVSRCSRHINGFISATEVEKKLKERRGLKRRYFIKFVIQALGVILYFSDIVLYIFAE